MTCSSTPDQTFVGDLYAQHSGWLHQWLMRRFGSSFNTADVADLTHDTFLRLLLKPRAFVMPGEARSFLCTVARGLCIDQWRRRQIEQAWLAELANRPEQVQPSPEYLAILLETLHEIDAMLRDLPHKARTAFLLAQLSGSTYREIAEQIGTSERMVKKYMAQVMYQCMVRELSASTSEF
ncbi:sigma-70 family RNA polymerase sigma factor [Pseudomonas syringae]|uniref:DNA-directed RNA polymerase specialized sigma subunit n=2 Tax=Pseudomonas syringae TaxID=317 RepID=A0A2G9KZE2_PSESF|nr:sigma-70 family RNA polymerase sigma factor [Pseudomonas syringae]EPM96081.1 ECF subfamily RNA polymerase sigma-24 subunit [Pseudomonas syringae pv. actinidiae ICMP 19070]AQL37594.1 RNA polymerase subunit sigma [Pseudomonas syringae pv. actinidiae ICMP 9853]ATV18116.1 RNA polymerase subunit sigma [Pseudomonas syringae pv. actinidiae]EGH65423.1 ECF sigma factor, FecI family protein [Pseudomonas syringae pv. actinidiae str. M302091]EPM55226.1 ECF subfamily RNA polymerase sigma-24 subunit [Pse